MARFFVEVVHKSEDCTEALNSIVAISKEFINRFDWACKSGEHTGWAIVEAGNESIARMMLPTSVRREARVVPVTKFTAEEVQSWHKEH